MAAYCIEIPNPEDKEAWGKFQLLMEDIQNQHEVAIIELAKEMQVSHECASDILYLRSRTRHTPQLEEELINLHRAGSPPNIFEFGCKFE